MMAYANKAGDTGIAPTDWPISNNIAHNSGKPTLVMFIHPKCPCSSATIGELAVLMAHCAGRVDAHVFFVRPAGMAVEWVKTDTWAEAMRIPGVTVQRDDNGEEATRFGVKTSGDTALYDTKGHLLFHGGITAARGHSGDNNGRDAIEALLSNQPAPQTTTPVFGCSLFSCPKQ